MALVALVALELVGNWSVALCALPNAVLRRMELRHSYHIDWCGPLGKAYLEPDHTTRFPVDPAAGTPRVK